MSTTIYQWAGSVLFVGDHKQFEVETPHLAAVVRGTRFRVTVNKDDTNVEVLGGRVEVTDFQSGQYVLVLPGQAVEVLVQGSPGLSLSGSGTLNPILQGIPANQRWIGLSYPMNVFRRSKTNGCLHRLKVIILPVTIHEVQA